MAIDLSSTVTSLMSRLSAWAGLEDSAARQAEPPPSTTAVLTVPGYKLTRWPDLPGEVRTARLLRALSMMSHRGVTARWFARQVGWPPEQATDFLEDLAESGDAQRVGC